MKIIAATHNKGKIKEIQEILGAIGFEVFSQDEIGITVEPEENGTTFAENAMIKARAVAELCDFAVIADDSGLCVDALGGAPGVYSARYAGEGASDADKIKKLLSELSDEENRHAKFISSIACILPDGEEITTHGEVPGNITYEMHGEGGFGYDPVFFSDELGKTFGEATADEKNKVSHRSRALKALFDILIEREF